MRAGHAFIFQAHESRIRAISKRGTMVLCTDREAAVQGNSNYNFQRTNNPAVTQTANACAQNLCKTAVVRPTAHKITKRAMNLYLQRALLTLPQVRVCTGLHGPMATKRSGKAKPISRLFHRASRTIDAETELGRVHAARTCSHRPAACCTDNDV